MLLFARKSMIIVLSLMTLLIIIFFLFLKIEKYVVHVLEQEAARDQSEPSRLSPEELQYAKEWVI